jgi:hypothetical protein
MKRIKDQTPLELYNRSDGGSAGRFVKLFMKKIPQERGVGAALKGKHIKTGKEKNKHITTTCGRRPRYLQGED